jgi:hypothetical protein
MKTITMDWAWRSVAHIFLLIAVVALGGCASTPARSSQRQKKETLDTLQQRLNKAQQAGSGEMSNIVVRLHEAIESETNLVVLQRFSETYPHSPYASNAIARVDNVIARQGSQKALLSWYSQYQDSTVRAKLEQRLATFIVGTTNIQDLLSLAGHTDLSATSISHRAIQKAEDLLREHFELISDDQYVANVSEKNGTLMLKSVLDARAKAGFQPGTTVQQFNTIGNVSTYLGTGHIAEDGVERIWYHSNSFEYDFYKFGTNGRLIREVVGKQFETGKRNVMTEIYSINGTHYRRSWISTQ